MNEPLFKNTFIRDENTAVEFYKHHYFTSSRMKTLHIGIPIILAVDFIGALRTPIWLYFSLICLCLFILLYLRTYFLYKKSIKVSVARDKEINNGEPSIKDLLVFDDKIIQSSPISTITLLIENIKEVEVTQNFIYVITKSNWYYDFKKDSFTLGNADDFIEFMKSKGIKIIK